jgi:alkanesulfonate monooxygenase SsuD/methylene tetrahydromethanopterin reductase-like flavin-dependent oxidoreductase (luciferase family)
VTPLWQDYNEVQDLIMKFNSAKKRYNPQSQSKIMLLQHTYVSDEKNELDEAAKKFSEFYAHFGAWFQNQRPVNQASIKKLSSKELSLLDMYAPEKMKKNLLFGTIDEVTSRLKDYEKLGYDEFSYWIDSGMSYDEKVSSLNNFIQRVMPAFKS